MKAKYKLGKKRKFKMPHTQVRTELEGKYREVSGHLIKGHNIPNITMFVYKNGEGWATGEYHTGLRICTFNICKNPEDVIDYTIKKLEGISKQQRREALYKSFTNNPKINRGGIGYRELIRTVP